MAEIDTRPPDSMQSALTLFEPKCDQSMFSSPDRNGQEIDSLTKELASCKLQLELKEDETKQANTKLEALQKTMQALSVKYDIACVDSHSRVTELETDNGITKFQQAKMASECKALKDELAVLRGELDALKGAKAYALEEIEKMETRRILETENTKEALKSILELNECVLSSAVAAIKAEEERSVFFQEVTLELFNSDRNLEGIKRQQGMIESMEKDLLAKTVEIEYLRSELKQFKELYISSSERVSDATTGCEDANHQSSKASAEDEAQEDEFTFQISPEACFVTQTVRKDSDAIEGMITEYAAAEATVTDAMACQGDKDINVNKTGSDLENQEPPQAEAAAPNGNSDQTVDSCFATDVVTEISKYDDHDGEFYTKEIGEAGKLSGGYVVVAKKAEVDDDRDTLKDERLDAAHAEISDLRFSLEEAVRRAELAEEAKKALERELKTEIQKKKKPPLHRTLSVDTARQSRGKMSSSNAPVGPQRPLRSCLTLGRVLNMKHK